MIRTTGWPLGAVLVSISMLGLGRSPLAQGSGTAVRLNGIDARGAGPGVGALVSNSTWEAWVRLPAYDPTMGPGPVLSRWGMWTSGAPWVTPSDGGCYGSGGYANPGDGGPGTNVGLLTPGSWHHIATVYGPEPAPGFTMFVDGRAVQSAGPGGQVPTSGWETDLGCWGYVGYGAFLKADVDEARLSNVPRYSGPFTPPVRFNVDSNTVALWHFDEGSGNVAFDASGHGVHLSLFGGYSWVDGVVASPFTAYCNAKLNSQGCLPSIHAAGSTSLTGADDLVLSATGVLRNTSGVLLWGTTSASTPFLGGTLCVAPPVVRTAVQAAVPVGSGPCDGAFDFHFTHAYAAGHFLPPGTQICAQFYSRDPGFPYPNNVGLTDAVRFTLAP